MAINRCEGCVTDKSECINCCDNPIYANVPRFSKRMSYIPTCPRGYTDCVYDPAYIKLHNPKWYADLYGDKTPEEAAEKCRQKVEEDPDEEYYCYDDEDK